MCGARTARGPGTGASGAMGAMGIERRFLDWHRPPLAAVAGYLHERYVAGRSWDLESVIVVVPGGRAGRLLLERLVGVAESEGLEFAPPEIVTVGRLPELLYEPKRPFASQLVQRLAWVRALRRAASGRAARFIPQLPGADDIAGWMRLAELLWRQHRELAADGVDFADVVRVGPQTPGFAEQDRWRFLRRVQQLYLEGLDELGLWDVQTARLVAVQMEECRTDRDVVLVGTVDMNRTLRSMLDQVAAQKTAQKTAQTAAQTAAQAAARVTALILAPPQLAERFDSHGCLDPAAWQSATIPLESGQIVQAAGPGEVAESVVGAIAGLAGRYSVDQITLGVADERLVPQLQRCLAGRDLPTRWVVGRRLAESLPVRLLRALADYLAVGRYPQLAALLRHPQIDRWLNGLLAEGEGPEPRSETPDWLAELDTYYQEHLPPRLGEVWLGDPERSAGLRWAHASLERLLEPLRGADRGLSHWAPRLAELLGRCFAGSLDRNDPADHYTLGALGELRRLLLEYRDLPATLDPALTAATAMYLMVEQLASAEIAPLPDPAALEMLGWLELPLDESPALIVTSMNEGHVPKSLNSDLFLPNALRLQLGLTDNARRYARDAYALSALQARCQDLLLIVARRDAEGDPLLPSRLLFACPAETAARRAVELFAEGDGESRELGRVARLERPEPSPAGGSEFFVPRPEPLRRPLTRLPVTAFRQYLACPYRFYLRHVRHLTELDDLAEELDAAAFGNVLHEVLRRFAESEQREATRVEVLQATLRDALERVVGEWFGERLLAAVAVQVQQIRKRLEAFAHWQAEWSAQGWRIVHTERPLASEPPAKFPVDGRPFELTGRIDRIDHHPGTGRWMIFDYKTFSTAKTPEKTHRQQGRWVDLQLPLYRYLAEGLGVPPDAGLAYLVLPRDLKSVGVYAAEWDAADLEAADEQAREVVRAIREQRFWPPTYPPPAFSESFAPICQDQTFERRLEPGPAEHVLPDGVQVVDGVPLGGNWEGDWGGDWAGDWGGEEPH